MKPCGQRFGSPFQDGAFRLDRLQKGFTMEFLQKTWNEIYSVVTSFRVVDIIDIALIAYLVYKGIQLVRETRAGQLVKGILALLVLALVANTLELTTLQFVIQTILSIGILAVIVIFQPELRRALEKVGRTQVAKFGVFGLGKDGTNNQAWAKAIDAVCSAAQEFSKTKTGALVVFERKIRLGEQISTGIMVNATPSAELFGNIFYPNTPLHDGAVVMRDGLVLAASCFLPKPQKEDLISNTLGSRHRAAIGISEVSDAITVVVSEETGTISVTCEGEMIRGFTGDTLNAYLRERLLVEMQPEDEEKGKKRRRKKKKKAEPALENQEDEVASLSSDGQN